MKQHLGVCAFPPTPAYFTMLIMTFNDGQSSKRYRKISEREAEQKEYTGYSHKTRGGVRKSVRQTPNSMRGLNMAVSQRKGKFSPRGKGREDQGLLCKKAIWKKTLCDME